MGCGGPCFPTTALASPSTYVGGIPSGARACGQRNHAPAAASGAGPCRPHWTADALRKDPRVQGPACAHQPCLGSKEQRDPLSQVLSTAPRPMPPSLGHGKAKLTPVEPARAGCQPERCLHHRGRHASHTAAIHSGEPVGAGGEHDRAQSSAGDAAAGSNNGHGHGHPIPHRRLRAAGILQACWDGRHRGAPGIWLLLLDDEHSHAPVSCPLEPTPSPTHRHRRTRTRTTATPFKLQ